MKKKIKKENNRMLKKYTNEVKRYIRILGDDFDKKVKAIAEQYLEIKKTLNTHTEMIASTQEAIEIIKLDIQFIKNSLSISSYVI
jgi:hypothetical protein